MGVLAGGRWILRDVSLRVPAGACCAVVGPNGCGKSTLARVLAGFVWPTVGQVSVLGRRFGETDLHALRQHMKLVQPNAPVDFEPTLRARDVVVSGSPGTIGLYVHPTEAEYSRADELMRRMGIRHLAASMFGTLSTGERMRALIARAMMRPPTLLLLDEPTAGLDLVGRELLLQGLDALMRGAPRPTVLLISHHLEELPRSTDWAIVMTAGGIVGDGPADEVFSNGTLSSAYGVPLSISRRDGRWTAAALQSGESWIA